MLVRVLALTQWTYSVIMVIFSRACDLRVITVGTLCEIPTLRHLGLINASSMTILCPGSHIIYFYSHFLTCLTALKGGK